MNKPVLRIMLSLSVALCLLATGCHSSRREAAVKTVEYDRPGLKGVEPSPAQDTAMAAIRAKVLIARV